MRKCTELCRPAQHSSAPRLFIERADFEEMQRFAVAAKKNEVCGYAFARQLDANTFYVLGKSVFIVDQHVNQGTARTDPTGEVAVMDYEEQFDANENVYRILWHSHVGGTASFSTTDLKSHHDIGQATALDAMFFMVINNRGQAALNFEVYRPYRVGTQALLLVIDDVPDVDLAPYKAQIAARCSVIPVKRPPSSRYIPAQAGFAMGAWDDDPEYDDPYDSTREDFR